METITADFPVAETSEADLETSFQIRVDEIRQQLLKLEKRDWWLSILAIVVMMVLTLGVVSLSFPRLLQVEDPFSQFSLDQSVRGLVALVLLFNTYSIYQQIIIKRLRRQSSEQLNAMGLLNMRAEQFHRLATTDPLTGLANRRSAKTRLLAEVARTERYGRPLTVVALDLDNFKVINDQHGHAVGDLVLREFAAKLDRTVRLSDLAVRMGGDEFMVVLPECTTDQVPSMVARLRPMEVVFEGKHIAVEFSVGCVGYQSGESAEQFLKHADEMLYADKREAKARVAPDLVLQ